MRERKKVRNKRKKERNKINERKIEKAWGANKIKRVGVRRSHKKKNINCMIILSVITLFCFHCLDNNADIFVPWFIGLFVCPLTILLIDSILIWLRKTFKRS
jgi:hypothetical protein